MSGPLIVGAGVPSQPSMSELFQQAERAFQADRYDEAAPIYRQLYAGQFSPGVMSWRLAAIANAQGRWIRPGSFITRQFASTRN